MARQKKPAPQADTCGVCGKAPRNTGTWECSHVDCPGRKPITASVAADTVAVTVECAGVRGGYQRFTDSLKRQGHKE